jgi:hypothetical protein
MSFDFSGWLTSIGLSQYAGTLSANGYDDYEVISALDETDRDVFPDIVPGHWKKLMIKVQQLKKDGGFQQPQAAWVAPPQKKICIMYFLIRTGVPSSIFRGCFSVSFLFFFFLFFFFFRARWCMFV